jgi:hypothetical protein
MECSEEETGFYDWILGAANTGRGREGGSPKEKRRAQF